MCWLLLVVGILLLAACSEPDAVTISPTLSCADEVTCHVLMWRLGVRQGPNISGTHIVCHCKEASHAA